MKKSIQASFVALALAGAVGAHAESFEVAAGTAFTKFFTFTPTEDNKSILLVTGMSPHFSELSFELTGGPSAVGTVAAKTLYAGFNDGKNANFELKANQGYTLKITGQTRANPPGGYGVVSISTVRGSVSPVPEPESYAMFLAGLGLMAAIVRRRSNKV